MSCKTDFFFMRGLAVATAVDSASRVGVVVCEEGAGEGLCEVTGVRGVWEEIGGSTSAFGLITEAMGAWLGH